MLSRRALIGKLAAGAAGAGVAWAANVGGAAPAFARGRANTPVGSEPNTDRHPGHDGDQLPAAAEVPAVETINESHPATVSGPPPWDLLRPLARGSVVAHGWRVADLSGVEDGSCVLTLQNKRGRTYRVHLCRNDGRPRGLVYTQRFDMVVMNGGQGDLPTEEGLAQAVAEVAHVLAANERRPELVAGLLPQHERARLFAGPEDQRLR